MLPNFRLGNAWRFLPALPGMFAFACLLSSPAEAQQNGQKVYTLQGTIESVDRTTRMLRVANDPLPGGMGAMTMSYSVDRDEILQQLKPGDRITAEMREGELKLYNIQVTTPASTSSQDAAQTGLALADLERIALENNPTIAQAAANLRVSSGRARQASLYPNPTVGYYGDEIRGGSYGGGKQGGFVSQTVVTGGKLRAARRVADAVEQQAQTLGELQRVRIVNNVRILFYEVLGAQRLVKVREDLSKLASDATQTSHQLANIGQADQPDVLQAEVEQQQAVVNLRIAQQGLRSSWRALAAVIGKPDFPLQRLLGDLDAIPDLDYDQWLATTLRDSPEIKLARQEVERAEALVSQAKKAPIPDLQLYGNLSQNYESLDGTRKSVGLNGGVQAGVQLPIFNRNQGNIAAALSDAESARQDVARIRLQLARDLAGRFREYEDARVTVQQYRNEILPRAEKAYRLYRANYQNMAAAYPQALISQRTLFQLEVDYVAALESAWQSSLAIRGFGLLDGLSTPMTSSAGALDVAE